jgi:hypothetical protein
MLAVQVLILQVSITQVCDYIFPGRVVYLQKETQVPATWQSSRASMIKGARFLVARGTAEIGGLNSGCKLVLIGWCLGLFC